jgi:hypothetical protein
VSRTKLEKKRGGHAFEKAQYALTFSVIAVMLYVAGFPLFFLLFVGVLGYFLWKVFSSDGTNVTRRIFEFYLSSYEILRSDDRKWFGYEVKEAILLGESITAKMTQPPPLVLFALGALYDKVGDKVAALRHLEKLESDPGGNEMSIVNPTEELRDYVRVLRKIERSPAQAPQTSAAFRALERMRRSRYKALLENVSKQAEPDAELLPAFADVEERNGAVEGLVRPTAGTRSVKSPQRQLESDRKTISEVLHDIYDHNVQ